MQENRNNKTPPLIRHTLSTRKPPKSTYRTHITNRIRDILEIDQTVWFEATRTCNQTRGVIKLCVSSHTRNAFGTHMDQDT